MTETLKTNVWLPTQVAHRQVRSGFTVIKDAFPTEVLQQCAEQLQKRFTAEPAPANAPDVKAAHQGVGNVDTRFDPQWLEPWKVASAALRREIGEFTLVCIPPQVRWIRQPNQFVPWHQDIAYQRKLGPRAHEEVLTVWVPLDPDPAQHATIEFGEWIGGELPHEDEPVYGGMALREQFDRRTYFSLHRGDCLVFGDLAPHRTFQPIVAKLERMSLEFRLVRPAQKLEGKDYFVVAPPA